MSPTRKSRPAVFAPDDPHVVISEGPDHFDLPSVAEARGSEALPAPISLAPARRPWPWRNVFLGAAGGLILMGLGLAVTTLIEDLFARFPPLGWTGLALAGIALLALVAIAAREFRGLRRLKTIENLRARAGDVLASDDLHAGRAVVRDLIALECHMALLASARARLQGHLDDIIDGAGLIHLAERELMTPLDREARRLVSAAAKRVSIVTAVSPRAVVDMLFVLITALGLARRLMLLYGGRPGTLGLMRLAKQVIAHLAITGGIAASDSLIQQVIGHGVAAKLSARLGEGVMNGLLTARLGLAAIEVTRPLPFSALPRPTLGDLASGLVRAEKGQPSPHDTGG
jgi:putative membrane protein